MAPYRFCALIIIASVARLIADIAPGIIG